MKTICYMIVCCLLLTCSSPTTGNKGSITITTNGMIELENDTMVIKVDVAGIYELQVKDIIGKSMIFIRGKGPTEFKFIISTTLKPGSYTVVVINIDENVIYTENFSF